MTKTIYQFGSKFHDVPEGMPSIDCRGLPNPYKRGVSDEILRGMVKRLPGFDDLVAKGVEILKTNDNISVFCLFGKHRSAAVSSTIATLTGADIVKLK
jgi:hypothetical protein